MRSLCFSTLARTVSAGIFAVVIWSLMRLNFRARALHSTGETARTDLALDT